MASSLNRRTLLRGLGAAVALPWMESLQGAALAAAGAQAGKPPVRLCFWYVPNGVHLPAWFPEREGALVDLPETLRPLAFARDALTTFHGLTHNTALTNGDSEGCGHGQGAASFLTGAQAYKTQDAVKVGMSADQVYAKHVGSQTRFPRWTMATFPFPGTGASWWRTYSCGAHTTSTSGTTKISRRSYREAT
ncbi:MAG: DUF1552 domain-containing protein [Thermoleophilia bacterium]|nr:DUF1552 domain-containing protein [Thermoleophilia bacterium]